MPSDIRRDGGLLLNRGAEKVLFSIVVLKRSFDPQKSRRDLLLQRRAENILKVLLLHGRAEKVLFYIKE